MRTEGPCRISGAGGRDKPFLPRGVGKGQADTGDSAEQDDGAARFRQLSSTVGDGEVSRRGIGVAERSQLPPGVERWLFGFVALVVGIAWVASAVGGDQSDSQLPDPAPLTTEVSEPLPLPSLAEFLTDNYGGGLTSWYPRIVGLAQTGDILVVQTTLEYSERETASAMCVAASAALMFHDRDPLVSVRDVSQTTMVRRTSFADRCD